MHIQTKMIHSKDALDNHNYLKSFVVRKPGVLAQIASFKKWKDVPNIKRIFVHDVQDVDLIVLNQPDGDLSLVVVAINSQNELVMDYVMPEYSSKDVKRMLDAGQDTSSFCTLGNAMFHRFSEDTGANIAFVTEYVEA